MKLSKSFKKTAKEIEKKLKESCLNCRYRIDYTFKFITHGSIYSYCVYALTGELDGSQIVDVLSRSCLSFKAKKFNRKSK
jgi:hypothetical protein